jgi:integrase
MTYLKIGGIKLVRANGAIYRYHRATGRRIKADPDAHPQAFLEEVKGLEAEVAARAQRPDPKPGALGGLFALYKESPEFTQLEAVTKKGYQRAIDALQTFDAKPLHTIDQPWVLKTRDEIFAVRGRWLANMVVAVLSVVLGWGVPRGLVKLNAAAGVPKIRRPKNKGVANKAWRPAEVDAYLKATYRLKFGGGGLRKAVALAYYGGLRKADVVRVPRTARVGGSIDMDMINKNGKELSIFEAKRLTAILNEKDEFQMGRAAKRDNRKPGTTLVLNRLGQPYTEDGLDSSFDRVKRELVEAGAIRPGLTFHGLRKSLGKRAADLGFSENDIAGALGQSNPASARPYTIEAARKKGALRVFKALDRKK